MNDITLFAETNFRNQRVKFGIKAHDRRKHLYIVGKTGMGKTTLLENMAIQDIQNGRGLAIVDPHGEFASKMLDYVPSNRINDVIYFNPADLEYPIAFNIVEKVRPEDRAKVTDGLVGIFQKLWAETWGPRLEYVLRNSILALLEYPGSTLLGIMRLLTDKIYRNKVIEKIKDPEVKSFWVNEFAKYPDRFMAEAVNPIQNKVGQFISNPLIRNIIGQTKSSINVREVMDQGKILIMNLSKGLIGEGGSALLGAMMITRLQLAAMSRVDMPEEERRDFYLYVDEFQNFATISFANILSEARKYRLNLILTHQYITQMVEEVRDAVFGNVGTLVSFRVGAQDAEYMEKEFAPDFIAQDLVNLDFANIYLKLMIDGIAGRPFSATTLPPWPKPKESFQEKIIKISRERYAGNRQEVEEKIARWREIDEDKETLFGQKEKKAAKAANQSLFDAVCSNCGKKTQVKFKPDPNRSVYCPECLDKVRQAKPREIKIEPEAKQPEKTFSLEEAFKREPKPFQLKKREKVDLDGLRKALKESLDEAEKGRKKSSR